MARTTKDSLLIDTLNRLARDMPSGYYIQIHVEKDSGYVELFGPDKTEIEFPSNMETLAEQLDDAFQFACDLASYGTAWKEHING